jgi:hypothetical protein
MEPDLQMDRRFGCWDALLAALLFGGGAAALMPRPRLVFPDWLGFWKGDLLSVIAVASAALVGLLHAPGLARRAWSGRPVAGRGARVVLVSYALASVGIAALMAIDDGSLDAAPFVALAAFVFACVVLSPGFLVGMVLAKLYGAIVGSEAWAPSVSDAQAGAWTARLRGLPPSFALEGAVGAAPPVGVARLLLDGDAVEVGDEADEFGRDLRPPLLDE